MNVMKYKCFTAIQCIRAQQQSHANTFKSFFLQTTITQEQCLHENVTPQLHRDCYVNTNVTGAYNGQTVSRMQNNEINKKKKNGKS